MVGDCHTLFHFVSSLDKPRPVKAAPLSKAPVQFWLGYMQARRGIVAQVTADRRHSVLFPDVRPYASKQGRTARLYHLLCAGLHPAGKNIVYLWIVRAGGGGVRCMAKEFAKAFYKSSAWKHCREGYIKSVGGLCEDCLKRGIYTPGKVVHHIIHLTPENIGDPSITLTFSNLRLVCQDCHAKEHKHSDQRYFFDENGHLIER